MARLRCTMGRAGLVTAQRTPWTALWEGLPLPGQHLQGASRLGGSLAVGAAAQRLQASSMGKTSLKGGLTIRTTCLRLQDSSMGGSRLQVGRAMEGMDLRGRAAPWRPHSSGSTAQRLQRACARSRLAVPCHLLRMMPRRELKAAPRLSFSVRVGSRSSRQQCRMIRPMGKSGLWFMGGGPTAGNLRCQSQSQLLQGRHPQLQVRTHVQLAASLHPGQLQCRLAWGLTTAAGQLGWVAGSSMSLSAQCVCRICIEAYLCLCRCQSPHHQGTCCAFLSKAALGHQRSL